MIRVLLSACPAGDSWLKIRFNTYIIFVRYFCVYTEYTEILNLHPKGLIVQTIMGEKDAYFCCPGTLKTDIAGSWVLLWLTLRSWCKWVGGNYCNKRCVLELLCFKMKYLYDIFISFPIKLRAFGSKCYNLQKIQSEHCSVCLCTRIKLIN